MHLGEPFFAVPPLQDEVINLLDLAYDPVALLREAACLGLALAPPRNLCLNIWIGKPEELAIRRLEYACPSLTEYHPGLLVAGPERHARWQPYGYVDPDYRLVRVLVPPRDHFLNSPKALQLGP